MWDGKPLGPAVDRYLDEFDVLVRQNEAVSILRKVQAFAEPTMDEVVSSRKPFGLPTNFKGAATDAGLKDPVLLFANQKQFWAERAQLPVGGELLDKWKVLMTRVQGTSAAVETKFLSKPIIAGPGTACTETYVIAGAFSSESEAQSVASYIRTRFARFLVSIRKSTQDAPRRVYAFMPQQPWDRTWTDEELYAKYGLTDEEIAFIESIVRPMEDE